MGSWGTGPFENDAAADLLAFLQKASPAEAVRLLEQAIASKYEDDIVAAGALLTGQRFGDQRRLAFYDARSEARSWARSSGGSMPERLRSECARKLERVLRTGSKLGWRNPQDERRWLSNIERIVKALRRKGRR